MKMKFNIFWMILLALAALSCERDPSPEQAERFIKFYGEYLMDEARDLAALDDGGFAICGVDSLPEVGKRMVLVITDEYGNLLSGFPKYYTEEDLNSAANSIVPIRGGQGGFLLAGYVEKPVDGSFATQKDIFLVKVSSTGAISWQKSYGSEDDEVILSASPGIVSGFMLAGYKVQDGKSDLLVVGVEQEGDLIDLPFFISEYYSNRRVNNIMTAEDRYICACTYDRYASADETTRILALSFDDDLVASPSPGGITGSSNEKGTCVIEAEPNVYLVLGNRIISGKSEIVVYKIETDEVYPIIKSSEFLTNISISDVNLTAEKMVKTADGRFAIVGTREAKGNRQIFLQFLSANYDTEELVIYGAAGDQFAADVDVADDGGLVLLGTNSVEESSMISLIKTNDTGGL
ncbi:MAG: hypothetical protein ACWGNV_00650 [Bacteroidales bacterium]